MNASATTTIRPVATITRGPDYDGRMRIDIDVTWIGADLDRPHVGGWAISDKPALATRLKTAIEAGAVYANPKIVKDSNGKTFVQAKSLVLGRHMNADLKRLGF